MSRPRVVILDGVTGSGKSELLAYAKEHPSGRYAIPTKLTTRPRRSSDNSWEFSFVTAIADSPRLVIWGTLGKRYAVSIDDVRDAGSSGRTSVLVCTEPSIIAVLAHEFDLVHIYLYRPMGRAELLRLLDQRGTAPDQIKIRVAEHVSVRHDYLVKIPTITATLLNVGDTMDLRHQFDEVMSRADLYCQTGPPRRRWPFGYGE
ncbi:MAG: hypothetical protein ACRDRW_01735 [Pseudonocardiaceae bacterium]